MLSWFVKTILSVLIDKFFSLSVLVFKNIALKKGIRLTAEKNVAHVAAGDAALSEGNVQGYLDALNSEE